MKINKSMIELGLLVVGAGLSVVSIIFTSKANKKLNKTCDAIGTKVDEICDDVEIDISEEIVEEAVKVAAARYARNAVEGINKELLKDAKNQISAAVKTSVDMAYQNIKTGIKEELARQVNNVDISGIKKQVIEEASEKAKEKFSNELDSIAARFSSDLESSSKIYKTIADKLGG